MAVAFFLPRNRYLQELTLFQYIQVAGGNKYREGYLYKITNMGESNTLNNSIENALRQTLENIKAEHEKQSAQPAKEQESGTVGQNPQTNPQSAENKRKTSKTTMK